MSPSTDVAVVLEQLVRVVRGMATAGGLSLPAAAVLARLLREGPCRLTDLATGEGVAQPSMTQLVTRLHRDGLVRRLDSASDGRVVLVDLTPAGRRLVQRRRAERAAAFDVLLDQLDPADRTAVQAALPALSRLADRALAPASRTATGVPA